MANSKILLFGSTGYIGSEFSRQISNVVCAPSYSNFKTLADCDAILSEVRPTAVINAAGFTGKPNVDACEHQKRECTEGNVDLPTLISEICMRHDIPFCHVSSGCIYTGYEKDFTEDDTPNFSFANNNCSFYSGTKADCEELLKSNPKAYIWRLRIPFNNEHNPRNYLTKMLTYNKILNLPNSVSHREEFVTTCLKTLEQGIPYGIYNVTNPGSVDAKYVLEAFSKRKEFADIASSKTFFKDEDEFMATVVAKRSNCVLNVDKLSQHGIRMRDVHDAIDEAIATYH